MIQDISPLRLINRYEPDLKPEPDDFVLQFRKNAVMVFPEENRVPKVREMKGNPGMVYLFSVDRERFFMPESETVGPEEAVYRDLRELRERGIEPRYLLFAMMTGKHLADWYRDNRFCGRCGEKMNHDEKERCMVCPVCGNRSYPRIMPAVIVGVINGNKLLLTRYRSGFRHNALVAGFVEIGETVEETAAREVMEETGLKVKNIRYYKSQPWGIANDILMGFFCEVDGDNRIRVDQSELSSAVWTERDSIELQPDSASLTNEMMKAFREGRI